MKKFVIGQHQFFFNLSPPAEGTDGRILVSRAKGRKKNASEARIGYLVVRRKGKKHNDRVREGKGKRAVKD